MNDLAVYGVIVLALMLANLPWVSNHFFVIGPQLPAKNTAFWRLLQWLIYLCVIALIAVVLEYQVTGTRYGQDWEFYASNCFLFMILSFPGYLFGLYQKASERSR